ncbi:hypothetical protein HMPREF1050_0982 [Haemophilus parahaemolyticus HK385]|uniref:Uncharacterized protein n=1 Tax=Haemophilus parahaemolyticus HK385 TaxID=1095744 RepID=A0ABN0EZ72_HAEPH|nr:hypothetical protein HMPREF1050_0982 [Haemophilus parahaemolyticus HK385]
MGFPHHFEFTSGQNPQNFCKIQPLLINHAPLLMRLQRIV